MITAASAALALLLAPAVPGQTAPRPTTQAAPQTPAQTPARPAPAGDVTSDLNSGPPRPATYLAPEPATTLAPARGATPVIPEPSTLAPARPVPVSPAPTRPAAVRQTPAPATTAPTVTTPAPARAAPSTTAPSTTPAPTRTAPPSAPVAAPPVPTPAPAPAAPAVTVLDGAARAALPFTVDLPTGFEIVTGRPGPDFRIYTIRRGGQSFAMVYAGPASQFPIYSGEMVEAGGRASVVVTEDGQRHALEHLFQRPDAPREIHVWTMSLDGADRALAERIAQTVDIR